MAKKTTRVRAVKKPLVLRVDVNGLEEVMTAQLLVVKKKALLELTQAAREGRVYDAHDALAEIDRAQAAVDVIDELLRSEMPFGIAVEIRDVGEE